MTRRLVALVLGLAVSRPAFAEEPATPPVPRGTTGGAGAAPADIGYRYAVDVPITVGAVGFWVLTEVNKPHLAPATCRDCEPGPVDARARSAVVWSDPEPARITSDVLVFGVAPLTAATSAYLMARADGQEDQAVEDILMIAEAAGIAAALNQTTKFLAARERPFVDALPAAARARTDDPADNNLSFFSGHTTMAFALTAATATVARLRRYEHADWAWAVGLPVAFATGYLRMAGDKHYLTDVLTGALVGTAVGWAVPTLHARFADRGAPRVAVVPAAGGGTVAVTWIY